MPWKPARRSLHVGPKAKLLVSQQLPEPPEEVTPRYTENLTHGLDHAPLQKDGTFNMSEFLSSLPVASQAVEHAYLNKFTGNLTESDHGDDTDIERLLFSDFGESSGSSSWNHSVASFMSWADEVENESTEKVRVLMNEIENTLYEDEPVVQNKEVLNECLLWKNKFPHLRVVGHGPTNPEELPPEFLVLEEGGECGECEVIARHGCCEDEENGTLSPRVSPQEEKSAPENAACSTPSSVNLHERVRNAVLEQLAMYALTEAVKSCPMMKIESDALPETPKQSSMPLSSDKSDGFNTDISEELTDILKVSRKSIHRSPTKSSHEIRHKVLDKRNSSLYPKRFLSSSNSFCEAKTVMPDVSFSVLGTPKPVYSEALSGRMKPVDNRGYHSAADRRKSGFWDRRYSCVSTDNDRLLKPLEESHGEMWGSPVKCMGNNSNPKHISAPNTPAKLSRHLTLPPIKTVDQNKVLNSAARREASLGVGNDFKANTLRKKGSLSPLPDAISNQSKGHTQLQLAKQLLERTPDRDLWSGRSRIGTSSSQGKKRRKKSKAKNLKL